MSFQELDANGARGKEAQGREETLAKRDVIVVLMRHGSPPPDLYAVDDAPIAEQGEGEARASTRALAHYMREPSIVIPRYSRLRRAEMTAKIVYDEFDKLKSQGLEVEIRSPRPHRWLQAEGTIAPIRDSRIMEVITREELVPWWLQATPEQREEYNARSPEALYDEIKRYIYLTDRGTREMPKGPPLYYIDVTHETVPLAILLQFYPNFQRFPVLDTFRLHGGEYIVDAMRGPKRTHTISFRGHVIGRELPSLP